MELKWDWVMIGKKIIPLSLLFSVLAGALIWNYVIPLVSEPLLRVDAIPEGAYIVPWMKPNPPIEVIEGYQYWEIDEVMAGALKLEMTFNLETPKGRRVVPSVVYLGHDDKYLYIGGIFKGMGRNPYNRPGEILYQFFNIYFDVAGDGVLTFPESGSSLEVAIGSEVERRNETDSLRSGLIWSYDDFCWGDIMRQGDYRWYRGELFYPEGQPAFGWVNSDVLYDHKTGTLVVLYSRHLRLEAIRKINALQMRPGERWVMGFLIELGYTRWDENPWKCWAVDGWPQKIFPFLSNNSSWWPKLVIDLTNPPKNPSHGSSSHPTFLPPLGLGLKFYLSLSTQSTHTHHPIQRDASIKQTNNQTKKPYQKQTKSYNPKWKAVHGIQKRIGCLKREFQ